MQEKQKSCSIKKFNDFQVFYSLQMLCAIKKINKIDKEQNKNINFFRQTCLLSFVMTYRQD